jgi:hypothetical protein
MILILDDVLSNEECSELINVYEDNIEYIKAHGNPTIYPLNIYSIRNNKNIAIEAFKKVNAIISKFLKYNIEPINIEIVKWPENSWQGYHTDITADGTVYNLSSVTYLNENFSGGCLQMIDGTKVKPKLGRTVVFDGCKYIHGVEPVQNNNRYTLPIWYRTGESW